MATLPKPRPGLVIRYSYLWTSEYDLGREEGRKDRPCAIILAIERTELETLVVALPVTHNPPGPHDEAIEIPRATKRRLGLDEDRSWIVFSEANEFIWPGFDLRPLRPGDPSSVAYGELPADLFRKLRTSFVAAYRARRARLVPRSQ